MKKEKMALDVVNPQAAGIDVGSRSHYVAIGQRDEDVKEFGVYNEDLIALSQWLLETKKYLPAIHRILNGIFYFLLILLIAGVTAQEHPDTTALIISPELPKSYSEKIRGDVKTKDTMYFIINLTVRFTS